MMESQTAMAQNGSAETTADDNDRWITRKKFECRWLPHGAYTLIPTTLATLAWIASLSQDGCDYARLEGSSVIELTGGEESPWLEVGMSAFRMPQYEVTSDKYIIDYKEDCISYGDVKLGVAFEAARIFAFTALVFGGGGALFLWFSSCFVFGPGSWKWAGYEVAIAAFFQVLAFCWYDNDICKKSGNTCTPHYGSNSDIIAFVFWLCAAGLIFRKYPEPTEKVSNRQGSDGGAPTEPQVEGLELPVAGSTNVQRMELANDPGANAIQKNVKASEEDAEII